MPSCLRRAFSAEKEKTPTTERHIFYDFKIIWMTLLIKANKLFIGLVAWKEMKVQCVL